MKEESKESSDGAASPLEEEEFENKEEKKKEKTEESSESVPTSPLDHNWGKGLIALPHPSSCRPLHTHVEALVGGCCDRPVCSKAEEEIIKL